MITEFKCKRIQVEHFRKVALSAELTSRLQTREDS